MTRNARDFSGYSNFDFGFAEGQEAAAAAGPGRLGRKKHYILFILLTVPNS
jgi:hypothetical protein